MPSMARFALAILLGVPAAGLAHGTAPGQGVATPMTQPTSPGGPRAPTPGTLSDGRPRQDSGGGAASTAPNTTSSLALPPQGQADPVGRK